MLYTFLCGGAYGIQILAKNPYFFPLFFLANGNFIHFFLLFHCILFLQMKYEKMAWRGFYIVTADPLSRVGERDDDGDGRWRLKSIYFSHFVDVLPTFMSCGMLVISYDYVACYLVFKSEWFVSAKVKG